MKILENTNVTRVSLVGFIGETEFKSTNRLN